MAVLFIHVFERAALLPFEFRSFFRMSSALRVEKIFGLASGYVLAPIQIADFTVRIVRIVVTLRHLFGLATDLFVGL